MRVSFVATFLLVVSLNVPLAFANPEEDRQKLNAWLSEIETFKKVEDLKPFEFEVNDPNHQNKDCRGHLKLEVLGPFARFIANDEVTLIADEEINFPKTLEELEKVDKNGFKLAKYKNKLFGVKDSKPIYFTLSETHLLIQEPDKNTLKPGKPLCLWQLVKKADKAAPPEKPEAPVNTAK